MDVESHPFALDTMLFMDWRDDYAASDPQMQAANRCATRPPFLVPRALSRFQLQAAKRSSCMPCHCHAVHDACGRLRLICVHTRGGLPTCQNML